MRNSVFSSLLNWGRGHLTQVFKLTPLHCNDCDNTFVSKSKLDIHIKSIHLKIKDLGCSECDKLFSRKSDPDKHEKVVHLKRKNIIVKLTITLWPDIIDIISTRAGRSLSKLVSSYFFPKDKKDKSYSNFKFEHNTVA